MGIWWWSGWWFGTFGLDYFFHHILGISSSQLTKSIIFQRGRAQPPTRSEEFRKYWNWWLESWKVDFFHWIFPLNVVFLRLSIQWRMIFINVESEQKFEHWLESYWMLNLYDWNTKCPMLNVEISKTEIWWSNIYFRWSKMWFLSIERSTLKLDHWIA